VQATSGGIAVLRSVGQQRFKGIDVEGMARPSKGVTLKASVGWNDARYRDYVTEVEGRPTQLAGHYQVLTPAVRAGGGLLFAPERGWRGSMTANWIGRHWLNSLNTFEAPAYAVVDRLSLQDVHGGSVGHQPRRSARRRAVERTGRRTVLSIAEPPRRRKRDVALQITC
jgi:hypothetical protein